MEETKEMSIEALRNQRERIQLPVNPRAWDHLNGKLTDQDRDNLLWFHQHVLNEGMTWDRIKGKTGYGRTTMWRVLQGTYQSPNWAGPLGRIAAFRKQFEAEVRRHGIDFVMNGQAKRVYAALDYALTQGTMVTIQGEPRVGKTEAAQHWCLERGAGKAVFLNCPVAGTARAVLADIAHAVGVKEVNVNRTTLARRVVKAFAHGRVLVIDEASHLLPRGKGVAAKEAVDEVRRLHDLTGCGIALLVTEPDVAQLTESSYMLGQLIGRIDLPAMLPEFEREDTDAIVAQFGKLSQKTLARLYDVALKPGRLGAMLAILKTARRIAKKAKREQVQDADVEAAFAHREEMTGGTKNPLNRFAAGR